MKNLSLGRILIGTFVILLGISLLFQQFDITLFKNLLGLFWPIVLVMFGIYLLVVTPKRVTLGIILFFLGLVLGASHIFNLNFSIWNFWPLVLIAIGLNVIFGNKLNIFKQNHSENNDELNINTIFWGTDKRIVSDNFKGGSLLVAFGGAKIDLRGVKFQNSKATINVVTAFGGTELLVDENTKVVNKGSGIFGAFEEESRPSASASQTLEITGFAAFGGVGIK